MRTPYIITKINDCKFMVHDPHPDALDYHCVDTIDEAKIILREKEKNYIDFINRIKEL